MNTKQKVIQKKVQVNLKRQIIVKAVVTQGFKDYLNRELTDTVQLYKTYITQIDQQLSTIDPDTPTFFKLTDEKAQYQSYIDSEEQQRETVEKLALDSLYSQGPIESLVPVSVGDNLYEQFSGVELIVKDGIVEKISLMKDFKPGMKVI